MLIDVIGAGSVGCTMAALLLCGAHDVILIGRTDQVNAIRRDGLRIEGSTGEFTVHPDAAVTFDSRPEDPFGLRPDLALLTVKTHDLVSALSAYRSHLIGVPILTMQNGVMSDDMAAGLIPRSQFINTVVVNLAANYLTRGRIEVAQQGNLVLGRLSAPGTQVRRKWRGC